MEDSVSFAAKDSFLDLERQRRRLEENVQQLRKSLQYWQLWEAEYEGLKEEIATIEEDQSDIAVEELEKVGEEFGGNLLNQKEINNLFKDGKGQARNGAQIQGLLSRRIEYVQENIKTMERRLTTAEEKLQATTVVSQPLVTDEEGLPLTEIREELDDDGNVISSSLSKPGDSTPQMLEALKKVGVSVPGQSQVNEAKSEQPPSSAEPQAETEPRDVSELQPNHQPRIEDEGSRQFSRDSMEHEPTLATTLEAKDIDQSVKLDANVPTKRPVMSSSSRKKSVSFSETVQVQPIVLSKEDSHISHHGRKTSQDLRDEMLLEEQKAFKHKASTEAIEFNSPISSPIIPPDESPEDATLRKQMLDYSMGEVSAIVAEINLDDNGSYDSERFDESDDTDAQDEEDEEEDEYGRTTKQVIDDDYRTQMLALERKLNARMMENVGPNGDIGVQASDSTPSNPFKVDVLKGTVSEKKAVRFADNLDISEATDDAPNLPAAIANPLSDIVEHPSPSSQGLQPTKSKKLSKFKAARAIGHDTPGNSRLEPSALDRDKPYRGPSFAPNETQKGTVLERAPPVQAPDSNEVEDSAPIPTAPDEFDDVTLNQELAMEYNRLRNRMIQRQGGFMNATEEEENEESEPSDLLGKPNPDGGKKVSRFKAARLRGLK